jgi:hypothetical protein
MGIDELDHSHVLTQLAEIGNASLSGNHRGQTLENLWSAPSAILNLHERIENKLFLDRTRKDSNFKRPYICATLFQIEKCWCPLELRH